VSPHAGARVPVRTCVGCGRRARQDELVRFAALDGALAAGRTLPGRGVYTCRREACFDRAAARRAFARTLRCTVSVNPELAHLYTGA
jgi:predicted RNA-binding protein YlxR (DUF448 family)